MFPQFFCPFFLFLLSSFSCVNIRRYDRENGKIVLVGHLVMDQSNRSTEDDEKKNTFRENVYSIIRNKKKKMRENRL